MALLETELERPDGPGKARGRALYTQDLSPVGMLHGALVRSPHAAARIVGIDAEAARRLEGVAAVLLAADLPANRYGIMTADEPVLAGERVRYVGEPVALVAAESAAAAQRAAALVEVDYEPTKAVVELTDALRPDSARVHDELPNAPEPGTIERGDVEAAFGVAAHVVETTVHSQRAHQAYIEPRVALAELDEQGRLIVTTSTQAPFEVRTGLCKLFDLPASRVKVRAPAIGGGFGGKLHLGMAPYAAALALATGRPVQVLCSRRDEMQSPAPRENSIVRIASALDADGRILGRRVTVELDSGAYAYDTPALAATAALQGTGVYSIPAVSIATRSVYTNTVPTGSFRAPTGPQMAYANEAHIEEVARRVGIDAIELRRRNIVTAGSLGPAGQVIDDPGMEGCLREGAERLRRWREDPSPSRPGWTRGVGLACAWWNSFPGSSAAVVTMHDDATVTVHTGATEIGTGAVSVALRAIVADELALPAESVHLISADTDDGPYDFGSQGSRTMYAAGGAAGRAAKQVRERLLATAAERLEVAERDLVVVEGGIEVRGVPASRVPMREIVAEHVAGAGPLVASESFQPVPPEHDAGCVRDLPFAAFNEPSFHCHAVEIDVERATGRIEVRRYAAIHDIGPVLNPAGARGQIEGGVLQGIGYALYEEMQSGADGSVLNPSLVDYRLPTIADLPDELEVVMVSDHPGSEGPRGAKGIGEAPIILPAAAIGAALRDGLGEQPLELPLDAPRVRALIVELDGERRGEA